MVSARIHRQVTFWTRVFSCFITGASLVFFSIILTYVLDDRFPAQEQGYSVLPVGSVSKACLMHIGSSECKINILMLSARLPPSVERLRNCDTPSPSPSSIRPPFWRPRQSSSPFCHCTTWVRPR